MRKLEKFIPESFTREVSFEEKREMRENVWDWLGHKYDMYMLHEFQRPTYAITHADAIADKLKHVCIPVVPFHLTFKDELLLYCYFLGFTPDKSYTWGSTADNPKIWRFGESPITFQRATPLEIIRHRAIYESPT